MLPMFATTRPQSRQVLQTTALEYTVNFKWNETGGITLMTKDEKDKIFNYMKEQYNEIEDNDRGCSNFYLGSVN